VVDRWVDEQLATGGEDRTAPGLVARAVDALLGVRLIARWMNRNLPANR
jgi:L-cysteine:1D-myo-inositol 2-amino-2-deoxy-alpha-D-glucopyranoside ligase